MRNVRRKIQLRRFELFTDVIITIGIMIGITYNVYRLPIESLCGYLVKHIRNRLECLCLQ